MELDPYDWVIVHKRGSQHTNADSFSRRPDLSAELMDSDAPDSTHTLVHTGTQTVMDNGPNVCDVETPIPTMSPTVDHSSSPGPHLPSNHTACGDQAFLYTPSHNGSSVRELQQSDTEIEQVLAWLEEGQRPPRWRLKDAGQGLKRLWHEFPRLTDCCVGCMADGTNNTNCSHYKW